MIENPGWYWPQDRRNVHLGINYRFWLARQRGERPVRILLGPLATQKFLRERGLLRRPRGTVYHGSGEFHCPVVFDVPDYGPWAIVVETRPLPPKEKRRKGG